MDKTITIKVDADLSAFQEKMVEVGDLLNHAGKEKAKALLLEAIEDAVEQAKIGTASGNVAHIAEAVHIYLTLP